MRRHRQGHCQHRGSGGDREEIPTHLQEKAISVPTDLLLEAGRRLPVCSAETIKSPSRSTQIADTQTKAARLYGPGGRATHGAVAEGFGWPNGQDGSKSGSAGRGLFNDEDLNGVSFRGDGSVHGLSL
jgi:hypothetical protein